MTDKSDIYQTITDQIVAAIEKGEVGKWQMPWHRSGAGMAPTNLKSEALYRGVNVLMLWATAQLKDYESNVWATYKQWEEKGCQVRKGEKATSVVFWKFLQVEGNDAKFDGDDTRPSRSIPMARSYAVFNADQVDGYTAPTPVSVPVNADGRDEHAENFFSELGGDVHFGGGVAGYDPSGDRILMPKFESFKCSASYYSVFAHEYTHWTGAPGRENRELKGRFGSDAYAMEELVAELGSAFVMADLGIESQPREDHAQYVSNWIQVLKADKRAIFTAASKAQQAVGFMHQISAIEESEAA